MSEQQNIEYKQSWHDDYLKWVCGFANAIGGFIYIGIDNNGNISHLTDYVKLLEDIPIKIRNLMGIICDVQLEDKQNAWGRGIFKILNACKEANLPDPGIKEMNGGIEVTLYKSIVKPNGLVDGLVDRLVDGLVDGLAESQQLIIKLIQSNPKILIGEMADRIGISKTAIDKNLTILKNKKIIRRVGNSKTGHWEILNNKT